jgi:hypothetical protein
VAEPRECGICPVGGVRSRPGARQSGIELNEGRLGDSMFFSPCQSYSISAQLKE